MRYSLLVLAAVLTAQFSFAATIHVPADQPTIQAGIDAAANRDTVLVAPGLYVENIDFVGKNIVLASNYIVSTDTSDILQTVIDGHSSGSAVKFTGGSDTTTAIIGFSIKNGNGTPAPSTGNYFGGGVAIVDYATASPRILHNYIYDNTYIPVGLSGGGAAIGILRSTSSSQILIEHNKMYANIGNNHAAAIYIEGRANVLIRGNIFYENAVNNPGEYSSVIEIGPYASAIIANNTIANNRTTGIHISYNSAAGTITNNIIAHNANSSVPTAGIYLREPNPNTQHILYNCLFNPDGIEYNAILPGLQDTTYTNENGTTCDSFYNIYYDPLFCYTSVQDYSMSDSSPCVGSGENSANMGALGIGCHLGATAFYVRGVSFYPAFDSLLLEAGLDVTLSDNIPEPNILNTYDVVLVNSYSACNSIVAGYLRQYLNQGGGVVLIAGTPLFLGFNNIADWFGATAYVNSGGKAFYVDNPAPFSTGITGGSLLTDHTGSGSDAAVTGVFDSTHILGIWQSGPVLCFWNRHQLGRVFYHGSMFSGLPQLNEDNNRLLWTAGVKWAAGIGITNTPPSVPSLVFPISEAIVPVLSPTFIVYNSIDAEFNTLMYDFEISDDSGHLVATAQNVPEGMGSTGWSIDTPLDEDHQYFWRARAFDGYEYSAWSGFESFWVNSVEQYPTAFDLYFPPDTGWSPVYDFPILFRWGASDDPDPLDSVRYKLMIAVDSNFTFAADYDSIYTDEYSMPSLNYGTHYWWKVYAIDTKGNATQSNGVADFMTWVLGDANSDLSANVGDAVYLIGYIFKNGPAPYPLKTGDANGDCEVNVGDVVYLINYIFRSGEPPRVGCAPPDVSQGK